MASGRPATGVAWIESAPPAIVRPRGAPRAEGHVADTRAGRRTESRAR